VVPFFSLVLCGFRLLRSPAYHGNATAGTTLQVTIGALTSYGASARQWGRAWSHAGQYVINVVQLFQGFFQAFGAMACFFALLHWHSRDQWPQQS